MSSATFAELLDLAVAAADVAAMPPPAPPAARPLPDADERAVRRSLAFVHARLPVAAAPIRFAPRPARPAPRRPRALDARQRFALDELNALGANLSESFTPAELKSAFRALARRHHPDRHQSDSAVERAHVTRMFAHIAAHYRCLTPVS